jgi:filamentous hemagglutinin
MRANANVSGTFVNPLTGMTEVANGSLAADHIVPQDWIRQQPGFDKLTAQQQSAVLNDPLNTQGLSTTFNASKGARMPGEW